MGTLVKALRPDSSPPFWCEPVLWFTALYGWIAEGGARSANVNRALVAVVRRRSWRGDVAGAPPGWRAGSIHRNRGIAPRWSRGSSSVLLAIRPPSTAVSGMTIFAAATLARSRRHALLLASYTGMAIAMASIELLTAGFADRLNSPRLDRTSRGSAGRAVLCRLRLARRAVTAGRSRGELDLQDCIRPRSADWAPGGAPSGALDRSRSRSRRHAADGRPLGRRHRVEGLALDVSGCRPAAELAFAKWTGVPCASVRSVRDRGA